MDQAWNGQGPFRKILKRLMRYWTQRCICMFSWLIVLFVHVNYLSRYIDSICFISQKTFFNKIVLNVTDTLKPWLQEATIAVAEIDRKKREKRKRHTVRSRVPSTCNEYVFHYVILTWCLFLERKRIMILCFLFEADMCALTKVTNWSEIQRK
jgi:hypothetical protein